MSKKLRELKAKKAALVQQATALTAGAQAESRDLSDEELTQFNDLKAQIEGANRQIEAEEFLAEQQRTVELPNSTVIQVEDNQAANPTHGFKSFGEFAQAVRNAGVNKQISDQRLVIGASAPASFGSEGVGSDGGFLIPPQFSTELWQLSISEDSLIPFTDNTPVNGNSMVFPKDETTPWGGDGIQCYWQKEVAQGKGTVPPVGTTTLRLHKLMTLVPLTDELMSDGAALDSYLSKKVPEKIRWRTNEAILFGTGQGQPLGALNSMAAIVQAKETNQDAGTLLPMNLSRMVSRLPPGSFGKAVWMINNDVLPALDNLTLGNYPIYMPISQGAQASPYGSLKGRPVNVSQHAKSFGNAGDINLVDLSYYRTITKSDGISTATSMHLYFDADMVAFRATFRIDGQPAISKPITPANGASTLSPFIKMGAR